MRQCSCQYSLGRRLDGQLGAALLVGGVEVPQGRRQPVGAHLGHHQAEPRVAVEDPTEHQLPHGPPRPQIEREEPLGVVDDLREQVVAALGFHLHPEGVDLVHELALLRAVPGVYDDRQSEVLTGRPERIEEPVVQRRQVRPRTDAGHVGPGEAVMGDPLELRQHPLHVRGRRRVPHEEDAVHCLAEYVRRPAVVGPRPGGDHVLGVPVVQGAEREDRPRVTAVDELRRNALAVHLRQTPVRVPGTEVAARLPGTLRVDHLEGLGREVGEHPE